MDIVGEYKKLCEINKTLTDHHIINALKNALSSGELDLSGHPVALGGWEILSRIITKNEMITKLKFCDCMIPPLGFKFIFNALMNSNEISEVDLFGNNMNTTTVIQLGKMLSINKSIKTLTLNWNNIGESLEAFSAFCGGLSQNESLEYLDLRNNQISSAGANELSSVLKQNHSLKFLDLRWNKLRNKGVFCLQNALKYNISIKELLIKGNFVHFQETTSIELCVKKNEEVDNIKMEYEMKIAFLFKKLKKLEDLRLEHFLSDVQRQEADGQSCWNEGVGLPESELWIQIIVRDFENKFEEFSQLLMKKEEQLRWQKSKQMKANKEASRVIEKVAKLKEEIESSIRKNLELEKILKEKENNYFTNLEVFQHKLKLEQDRNEKLLQEINDKNKAVECLKNDIAVAKLEWETCASAKTDKIENQWKAKLEDLEKKYSKQIVELREQLVEKEISFLKEEEEKIKNFRIRTEKAEKRKSSMETEILSLLDKTTQQESRMVELQKQLTFISEGFETTQQDLKNARNEIKKYMEALNRVNDDLIQANQTIEKLKIELLEEKEKFRSCTFKHKELNEKIAEMKEEDKLRSELLGSALRRYLRPPEN